LSVVRQKERHGRGQAASALEAGNYNQKRFAAVEENKSEIYLMIFVQLLKTTNNQ
jgi:hypothetical protein